MTPVDPDSEEFVGPVDAFTELGAAPMERKAGVERSFALDDVDVLPEPGDNGLPPEGAVSRGRFGGAVAGCSATGYCDPLLGSRVVQCLLRGAGGGTVEAELAAARFEAAELSVNPLGPIPGGVARPIIGELWGFA